jgi:hypothetical protein
MEERIKEILGELDCDIYWKDCNFPTEVNGELMFYSRDDCKNISFKDLLKWYIPRLGDFQGDLDCEDCNEECKDCEYPSISAGVWSKHLDLFLELIDYYSLYRIRQLMDKENKSK